MERGGKPNAKHYVYRMLFWTTAGPASRDEILRKAPDVTINTEAAR